MWMEQKQTCDQKLVLTQTMRQSLDCLQFSAVELCEYVQEIALSNPLLDVQAPTYYETQVLDNAALTRESIDVHESDTWNDFHVSGSNAIQGLIASLSNEKTFRDYLHEQIGQMKLVDDEFLQLCYLIIECLDERGYLSCSIEDLSAEFNVSSFLLEQALLAVQMLDPPGVGARNLSECLTLQLVQGDALDPLILNIVRSGLDKLGKQDYLGLSAMFGVSMAEVKTAVAKVLELNPIPSRGFAGSERIAFIAPDAEIFVQQDQLVIELNERILPKLSINTGYSALINSCNDPDVQYYVKEKLSEAQNLIKGIHSRCDTLVRILIQIGREQHAYFCTGEALKPITMQQIAKELEISASTVSRAVKSKYIQFNGKIIPVRAFFTTAIHSGETVSSHTVKQRIQDLIHSENATSPLSDEALRLALSALGIDVSRRVITKYRLEMGIPSSTQRRK